MRPPRKVQRCHAGCTRDPWPCCGKDVGGQRLKTATVCRDCADLMADGRRLRAIEAEGDAVEYTWWTYDYATPRLPGPHREIVAAFDGLVRAVADVRPDQRPAWPGTPLVESHRAVHEFADFRCVARCTPTVRAALAALHEHVAAAIVAAEAQGRRRGSSLLHSLAAGDITVDEFDKGAGR